MSVICDVVVYSTFHQDRESGAAVEFDRGTGWTTKLNALPTENAGGTKTFCGYVWAAALNHIAPADIERAIAAVDWRSPEDVIVMLDPYDYGEKPYAKTVEQIRREQA